MVEKYTQQKHEEWLLVAESDLIAAEKLIKDDDATLGPAIYHSQQCAEKALKAYLFFHKQIPRKTHDLVALAKACKKIDLDFEELVKPAISLNPHSTKSRYPDDRLIIPFRDTVILSIEEALLIYNFVRSKINDQKQ